MKKIVTAIIILLILMIVTIGGIILVSNYTNNEEETITDEGDAGIEIDYDETVVEAVTSNIDFFTVYNYVQKYLTTINVNLYAGYGDDDIDYQAIQTEQIYDLLSTEYIQDNGITTSNIFSYVETINEMPLFIPLEMNYLNLVNTTKYAVYGIYSNWDYEFKGEVFFIVNVDNTNKTFEITPLNTSDYTSVDEVELTRDEVSIEETDNNSYTNQNITDQYLCEKYLLFQKRLMLIVPEYSYYYLNEEYREERFGTLENYLKYVSENREHIENITLSSYNVERTGDKTIYTCQDKYANYYIFEAEEVMNYKVQLDGYTLDQDSIVEQYEGYNDIQKMAYNVYKWVQMINNKDYSSAYEVLNETFRNNNWSSVDEFETYIKENYPAYYEVNYNTYTENVSSTSYTITLTDIDGNEQSKTLTVTIRLIDDTDFEMSFSV